jgi:hypothetical protein
MPILNKGETFVDGQQVSGQRLNDLIDNATALPELITTQTPIADPVADGDGLLIHDASAAALRKVTVQELFAGDVALIPLLLRLLSSTGRPEPTSQSIQTMERLLPEVRLLRSMASRLR